MSDLRVLLSTPKKKVAQKICQNIGLWLLKFFFAGPAVAASIAEGFGGSRPQFQGQGSSSGGLFSTIESFIGGGNSGGGQFGGGQASSGGGFLNTLENLVFGTRRTDGPPPPQRPFRPPQRPFSRPPPRPVRRRPPPNRRPIPQNQFFGRRQDENGFRHSIYIRTVSS